MKSRTGALTAVRNGPGDFCAADLDVDKDSAVRSANASGEGAISSPRGSLSGFPVHRLRNLPMVSFIACPRFSNLG